jgi:hypothetical protein
VTERRRQEAPGGTEPGRRQCRDSTAENGQKNQKLKRLKLKLAQTKTETETAKLKLKQKRTPLDTGSYCPQEHAQN